MTEDPSEERFRRLYERTWRPLLAYAKRRTASPEDAADVWVETFTIAWQHLGDVPDDENSVLWLYATARGTIANFGRRAQARARLAERISAELSRDVASHAYATAYEDAVVAIEALASLGDEDRELLMLAAWEGLGSAQLGRLFNCSTAAARVRLHRARARLRASLGQRGLAGTPGESTPRPPTKEVDKHGRNAAVTQP